MTDAGTLDPPVEDQRASYMRTVYYRAVSMAGSAGALLALAAIPACSTRYLTLEEAALAFIIGSVFQGKAAVFAELVRGFGERRTRAYGPCRTGSRGAPADPRLPNPCFAAQAKPVAGGAMPAASRVSGRTAAPGSVLAASTR